jgi:hypothetical protein
MQLVCCLYLDKIQEEVLAGNPRHFLDIYYRSSIFFQTQLFVLQVKFQRFETMDDFEGSNKQKKKNAYKPEQLARLEQ